MLEQEDDVTPNLRSEAEASIETLRNALRSSNVEIIRQRLSDLDHVLQSMGTAGYQTDNLELSLPSENEQPITDGGYLTQKRQQDTNEVVES